MVRAELRPLCSVFKRRLLSRSTAWSDSLCPEALVLAAERSSSEQGAKQDQYVPRSTQHALCRKNPPAGSDSQAPLVAVACSSTKHYPRAYR